jgi:hypothetical protein
LAGHILLATLIVRGQGILGTVVEEFSRQVIANAEIQISIDDSLLQKVLTDSLGHYTFHTTAAGRVEIGLMQQAIQAWLNKMSSWMAIPPRLEHLLKKMHLIYPQ